MEAKLANTSVEDGKPGGEKRLGTPAGLAGMSRKLVLKLAMAWRSSTQEQKTQPYYVLQARPNSKHCGTFSVLPA